MTTILPDTVRAVGNFLIPPQLLLLECDARAAAGRSSVADKLFENLLSYHLRDTRLSQPR